MGADAGTEVEAKMRRSGPARRWTGLNRAKYWKGGRWYDEGRRRSTTAASGRRGAEPECTMKTGARRGRFRVVAWSEPWSDNSL